MSDFVEEFKAGLEGIVAAESAISRINGQAGELIYAGYRIKDLARTVSFEEVCYLLWHLRLPNRSELSALQTALQREAVLPRELLEWLKTSPRGTRPMHVLRTAASYLAHFDPEVEDNAPEALLEKAIRLTARIPMVVAAFDRIRNGKAPVTGGGSSIAERFLFQLKGEPPIPEAMEALDAALTLHADHGFNASTFAARVTMSTRSDIYSAVTSAIGALRGSLHGGANERVIAMLQEIKTKERARTWVAERLANGKRIFGFGHRVYKTLDPRAKVLKEMSEKLGKAMGQPHWYELSAEIAKVVKEGKGIDANVDFYSASVYHVMGIAPDLFTPIFAISRVAGWTAHIMEQMKNNRLIRPLSKYIGPEYQEIVPIDKR